MGTLEDYYRNYGTDEFGHKFSSLANTSGLDPSQISTIYTASKWRQPDENKLQLYNIQADQGRAQRISDPTVEQSYMGPGGKWTSKNGGIWQNAQGKQTADLAGYLKKGSLQQTGADYSDYQNQLKALLADPSKIQQTAGYQFQQRQGEEAINRSAAARGSLGGGGVLAELAKYGQGLASQEYGSQVARLADLMKNAQQFGVQSGYYQDLQNPVQQAGGQAVRSASQPAPQRGVYDIQAENENSAADRMMSEFDKQKKYFADKDAAARREAAARGSYIPW